MIDAFILAWMEFSWAHPLASAVILAVFGGVGVWIVALWLYVFMPGHRLAVIVRPHTADPCYCKRSHPALNEPGGVVAKQGPFAEDSMTVFERGPNRPKTHFEKHLDQDRLWNGPREGRRSIQPSEPWPEPGVES